MSEEKTPYAQLREQFTEALTAKVEGTDLREVSPHDLIREYDIDISVVHPETVRALCHYVAVLVYENTGVGVKFNQAITQNREWVGEGYDGHYENVSRVVSKFIINRVREERALETARPKSKLSRQAKRALRTMTRRNGLY